MDLNDPETWRWIWLGAVVFFALGELSVPGSFFMLSFAIGAAVADALAFAGVTASVQWLVFVVVSGASLAVLVPIGRRMDRSGAQSNVGATRWLGRTGTVLTEVPGGPHETGLVRVEREEWRAESVDGRAIVAGTHVTVLRVDGTRLIVGPADAAPPAATGSGSAEGGSGS
ncbi:MAG: NfeD family protein [Acidimicrobiia bacterium]|nr:NfeD family protein [Acidimicrobiia bacterium]